MHTYFPLHVQGIGNTLPSQSTAQGLPGSSKHMGWEGKEGISHSPPTLTNTLETSGSVQQSRVSPTPCSHGEVEEGSFLPSMFSAAQENPGLCSSRAGVTLLTCFVLTWRLRGWNFSCALCFWVGGMNLGLRPMLGQGFLLFFSR